MQPTANDRSHAQPHLRVPDDSPRGVRRAPREEVSTYGSFLGYPSRRMRYDARALVEPSGRRRSGPAAAGGDRIGRIGPGDLDRVPSGSQRYAERPSKKSASTGSLVTSAPQKTRSSPSATRRLGGRGASFRSPRCRPAAVRRGEGTSQPRAGAPRGGYIGAMACFGTVAVLGRAAEQFRVARIGRRSEY